MHKSIGVLLVHGLGPVEDDFAHDAIKELRERVCGKGINCDEIAWQSVHWAPILAQRENQLWVDAAAEHDLNWTKLRKFFINSFGETLAYESHKEKPGSVYAQIQDAILNALRELRAKLGSEDKPLVIMAHSLGTVIVSDYIWDRQKGTDAERFGATSFERMETLTGLVTLGAINPLFTLANAPVTAIEFPPPALPEKLKKKAKWLNMYDTDDVLGWPLKQLSMSYADAVSEDIEVSVGNILAAWNPIHHSAYWTDESVVKPVSYLLASVLEAEGVVKADAAK